MNSDEEDAPLKTAIQGRKYVHKLRLDSGNTSIQCPTRSPETVVTGTVETTDTLEDTFSFFKAPRSKKLLLLCLALANFCAMACFSLLSPFFAKEAKLKNVSDTVIGLIFGSFQCSMFLVAPVYGNYMTQIGSKFLFLAGVGVSGVCAIVFGLLNRIPDETTFISFCFVTRSIEALGAAAYLTASYAIISHAYPKHVSTVIGILETFTGLGMMVGPAVGSALYTVGGFGLPFYVMGGVLLVCGVCCCFVMPSIEDKKRTLSRSVLFLLRSPLCVLVCFITSCGSFGFSFLEPVYAERLDEIHLSTVLVGVMFLIYGAMYALGAPVWGWIGDTKGIYKGLIILGNFLTGFAYMILAPSPFLEFYPFELWSQVLALVLLGIFAGAAIIPTYKVLCEGAVKQLGLEDSFETHGLVSGLYNSSWYLGAFVGPMTAGALVQEIKFPWACTSCGVLFLSAGLLMLIYVILEKYTTLCPSQASKSRYEQNISNRLLQSVKA